MLLARAPSAGFGSDLMETYHSMDPHGLLAGSCGFPALPAAGRSAIPTLGSGTFPTLSRDGSQASPDFGLLGLPATGGTSSSLDLLLPARSAGSGLLPTSSLGALGSTPWASAPGFPAIPEEAELGMVSLSDLNPISLPPPPSPHAALNASAAAAAAAPPPVFVPLDDGESPPAR